MAEWIHSMHGVPWTQGKMAKAVKILRQGAIVTFVFGAEKLEKIFELNEKVFSVRKDLILHVSTVAEDGKFTQTELEALASLSNIRNLEVIVYKNKDLNEIGKMSQLESLIIRGSLKKTEFISKLKNLQFLCISGGFKDFENLTECHEMKRLIIQSANVPSLDFLVKLKKLENVLLDYCTIGSGYEVLAYLPSLKELSISSIANLEDVSFLTLLKNIESLKLSLAKVKRFPNGLASLKNLRKIELSRMLALENPGALEMLPNIEGVELKEMNTKLKAEDFLFLAKMPKLQKLDIRFLYLNPKRVQKIHDQLVALGKKNCFKF